MSDSLRPHGVLLAPPSIGFPRQEYWSGLPFPSPGKLPDPGIEPIFPALARRFFTTEPLGKLNFFNSLFSFFVMVVHSFHCYKYSVWWNKYFYTCGWVFGLFPALYWRVFGRLPDFGCYEQCLHEHNCLCLLVYMCGNFSGVSVIPLMSPQGISGLHSVFAHEILQRPSSCSSNSFPLVTQEASTSSLACRQDFPVAGIWLL